MKQSQLLRLLLLPSLFSLVSCLLLGGIILIAWQWRYFHDQPFFVTYVTGQYGIGNLLSNNFTRASQSLLLYNLTVLIVSALIGVLLYVVLRSVGRMLHDARQAVDETHYVNQRASNVTRELALRLGLRAITLVSWLIYTFVWLRVILPVGAELTDVQLRVTDLDALMRYFGVYALLLLSLHIHVIFLRLLLLRPRLFSLPDYAER